MAKFAQRQRPNSWIANKTDLPIRPLFKSDGETDQSEWLQNANSVDHLSCIMHKFPNAFQADQLSADIRKTPRKAILTKRREDPDRQDPVLVHLLLIALLLLCVRFAVAGDIGC